MNIWSFDLPIPPSVNGTHRHGGGRCWLSPEYRDWRLAARITIASQSVDLTDKPTAPYGVRVTLRGGKGWRKGRDLDNCGKAIFDILSATCIIEDDSTDFVHFKSFAYLPPIRGKSATMTVTIEEWRG